MNVWIGAAVFSALSVCFVASPKIAKSRSGDYVTARAIGGFSTVDDISENASGTLQINNSEDVVAGLEIALGYDWSVKGVPVRSEIAYHHRFRFDFDVRIIDGTIVNGFENNLRSDVVLVNLFYDIELQSMWRPYVGGGVGWVHNTSDVDFDRVDLVGGAQENREDTTDDLAWWIGIGLNYRWSDRWWLELGYRYIDLGRIESGPFNNGTVIEAEQYVSHDIAFGLQYRF